jgi:hypothetical protein
VAAEGVVREAEVLVSALDTTVSGPVSTPRYAATWTVLLALVPSWMFTRAPALPGVAIRDQTWVFMVRETRVPSSVQPLTPVGAPTVVVSEATDSARTIRSPGCTPDGSVTQGVVVLRAAPTSPTNVIVAAAAVLGAQVEGPTRPMTASIATTSIARIRVPSIRPSSGSASNLGATVRRHRRVAGRSPN